MRQTFHFINREPHLYYTYTCLDLKNVTIRCLPRDFYHFSIPLENLPNYLILNITWQPVYTDFSPRSSKMRLRVVRPQKLTSKVPGFPFSSLAMEVTPSAEQPYFFSKPTTSGREVPRPPFNWIVEHSLALQHFAQSGEGIHS